MGGIDEYTRTKVVRNTPLALPFIYGNVVHINKITSQYCTRRLRAIISNAQPLGHI